MEEMILLPETRRERRERERQENERIKAENRREREARAELRRLERQEIENRKLKNSQTECSLDELLFPVSVIDNPNKTNTEYSRVVVGMVNDEEMHLNYCSKIYKLMPNERIFPEIEKVLDSNNVQYEKKYSHINYVKFYVEYKITDPRFVYKMKGTNDEIFPLLRVQHSYNGLVKYKIIFGYFRVICSNGLVIAVEEMKQYNLIIVGKHTEIIVRSFSMLDKMLKNFTTNADKIIAKTTAKYELLGGRWIENPEDRITEVLKANKVAIVENSKTSTMNFILDKIRTEADSSVLGYNGSINDWLIYNGINQYIYKSKNIMTPDIRLEKDSKILEYMLKYAPAEV